MSDVDLPQHIVELAQAIATQAEALAEGRVAKPLAAAKRLAANADTLVIHVAMHTRGWEAT
jgi:hypothetical protein